MRSAFALAVVLVACGSPDPPPARPAPLGGHEIEQRELEEVSVDPTDDSHELDPSGADTELGAEAPAAETTPLPSDAEVFGARIDHDPTRPGSPCYEVMKDCFADACAEPFQALDACTEERCTAVPAELRAAGATCPACRPASGPAYDCMKSECSDGLEACARDAGE